MVTSKQYRLPSKLIWLGVNYLITQQTILTGVNISRFLISKSPPRKTKWSYVHGNCICIAVQCITWLLPVGVWRLSVELTWSSRAAATMVSPCLPSRDYLVSLRCGWITVGSRTTLHPRTWKICYRVRYDTKEEWVVLPPSPPQSKCLSYTFKPLHMTNIYPTLGV